MIIKKYNLCALQRWLLIALISTVFFLIGSTQPLFSQNFGDEVSVSFVKDIDSLKTSQLYFNILKVKNNTFKIVKGNVSFSGPENWNLISFPTENTTILPGDSAIFPIRVSPNNDALGGTTYILSGTFRSTKLQATASTYLVLPSASKWEFSINKNSIYFTDNSPNVTFQVHLSNKGNTNELIKLHYDLGKLLQLSENAEYEYDEFIQLQAFKDTTISHTVSYQKKLSDVDRMRYERNWKESSLKAIASSELESRSAIIMFHKLNSVFVNQRQQNSSPLNLDYQLNNLMSSQEPTSNVRLYGNLLLAHNRELQYYAGVNSFDHQFDGTFDIDQQLMYSLRYTDLKNNIELGYNIYGGNLHTINGRGLMGTYSPTSRSKFTYAFTQNPFSKNLGGHVGFSSSIGKLRFNTNVIREQSESNDYIATSVSTGVGFRLFKYHSFNLQFAGTESNYKQAIRDTTLYGYSYRVNYSVRLKNFEFRASGMNTVNNYYKNAGLEQYYVDGKLALSKKTLLILYGNRQYYSTTRYPYNFDHPVNYNSNDYLRLTTSISSGNVNYQVGPDYNGSMRQLYNSATGYKSVYETRQPGIWGAISVRLNGNRTITPNITLSDLQFSYISQDPTLPVYSSKNNFSYSAGINYFDNNWRFNAYYTSGSTSDLYRSIQIGEKPVVSNSIQFRPSYENYFFNRKVKLSFFVNYAYYMPSGRENVSYNIRYDHFLKKGWELSVNGFVYSNSRTDSDIGRISTRDMNFIIGFRKSFNIQQPRQKYYNFKTVFFNDLDGDRMKTDNEPPVSNVLVNIEKDKDASEVKNYIPETELLSDVNGEVYIENLPQDRYNLQFTPLVNLKSLYFLNGANQTYNNDKNRTLYVPLAESYKIKGKINLLRDPNSSEGKINLNGIRITATGQKGETYSVLTDNFGAYLLNVPNADRFKVRVNNVLGEHFRIETDEMEVQFTSNKTINLDFNFIEQRRNIQFENGTELFKFSSLSDESEESTDETENTQTVEPVIKSKEISKVTSGNAAVLANGKKSLQKNNTVSAAKVTQQSNPNIQSQAGNKQVVGNSTDNVSESGVSSVNNQLSLPKKEVVVSAASAQNEVQNVDSLNKPNITSSDASASEVGYRIQLGALREYQNPEVYRKQNNLTDKVQYAKIDGLYKYYSSVEYPTLEAAKDAIMQQKINGFAAKVDPSVLLDVLVDEKGSVLAEKVNQEKKEIVDVNKAVETEKVTNNQAAQKVDTLIYSETAKELTSAPKVIVEQVFVSDFKELQGEHIYSIQLESYRDYIDPELLKDKYNLKSEVVCVEVEGVYRYFTGRYTSKAAAVAEIAKYGLSGRIMEVDLLNLKSYKK